MSAPAHHTLTRSLYFGTEEEAGLCHLQADRYEGGSVPTCVTSALPEHHGFPFW